MPETKIESEVKTIQLFETGLGVPAVTTAQFPHPDTMKSYNFNLHNNASTSTIEGRTVMSFDNTVAATKVMKMVNSEGEVIGFFDKKTRIENTTPERKVSKKTNLSTRANKKNSIWGNSKVTATDSSALKMQTGTEFEKNAQGIVVNLDNKEYNAAVASKRKVQTDAYETEKIRNTINVLKTELPADINELKSMVSLIMKHLGLNIATATTEEIGDETNISTKMDEMYGDGSGVVAKAYKKRFETENWEDWYVNAPNAASGVVKKIMVIGTYENTYDDEGHLISSVLKEEEIKAAPPEKPKSVIQNTGIATLKTDVTGVGVAADIKKNMYIS